MDDIANDISSTIGRRIHAERVIRDWSLAELAERSGVSKAMLSTIERGKTSPTAALLVRIASAFGMTLSTLIARAELQGGGLLREIDQPVWRDPDTGHYGDVVPSRPYKRGVADCRDYTHTIYIDGKPKQMRGTACRDSGGSWKSVG